ncbi:hypothetical protein ABT039_22300 [Streptomyces lasiicapitis]|uniref:hypothetical protein n=1 Tax=Streptomyces lasiicapitis TaxID=1923961 RepID=UPI0033330C3C
MDSAQSPEPAQPTIRVHVDTTAALQDIERCRAALLFAWHDDLVALDDELDILFRGQL